MTSHLTPYDTGRRAEPKVWPVAHEPGNPPLAQRLEDDRYGKTDFDDSEGVTVVTVWVELDAAGNHTLHVQDSTDDGIRMVLHG